MSRVGGCARGGAPQTIAGLNAVVVLQNGTVLARNEQVEIRPSG